ncbi:hypothetical protein QOT17_015345 [Balamuthia mandrillaris]
MRETYSYAVKNLNLFLLSFASHNPTHCPLFFFIRPPQRPNTNDTTTEKDMRQHLEMSCISLEICKNLNMMRISGIVFRHGQVRECHRSFGGVGRQAFKTRSNIVERLPPIWSVCSRTTTLRPSSNSDLAAVNPLGPAPITQQQRRVMRLPSSSHAVLMRSRKTNNGTPQARKRVNSQFFCFNRQPRVHSSVAEHLVYTEKVVGSKPAVP